MSCSTNASLFVVAIEAMLSRLFIFLTSKDENNSPRMNDFQNVAMLFFHRFTLVPYDDKNIAFYLLAFNIRDRSCVNIRVGIEWR